MFVLAILVFIVAVIFLAIAPLTVFAGGVKLGEALKPDKDTWNLKE